VTARRAQADNDFRLARRFRCTQLHHRSNAFESGRTRKSKRGKSQSR
jgi:hypothetical protein